MNKTWLEIIIITFFILIKEFIKYGASCSQKSEVSSLVSLLIHFRTSLTSNLSTLGNLSPWPASPRLKLVPTFPSPSCQPKLLIQSPTLFKWQGASFIKTIYHCVNRGGVILAFQVSGDVLFNSTFLKLVFLPKS